jgi:hypothetical protein
VDPVGHFLQLVLLKDLNIKKMANFHHFLNNNLWIVQVHTKTMAVVVVSCKIHSIM